MMSKRKRFSGPGSYNPVKLINSKELVTPINGYKALKVLLEKMYRVT